MPIGVLSSYAKVRQKIQINKKITEKLIFSIKKKRKAIKSVPLQYGNAII